MDREKKYKLTMRLYDMTQELAYLVYGVVAFVGAVAVVFFFYSGAYVANQVSESA